MDHELSEYSHINNEVLLNKYTVSNVCTNVNNVTSEDVLLNKINKGASIELEVKHDANAKASDLAITTTTTTSSIEPSSTEFYGSEKISLEDSLSINDIIHPSETLYLSITRGEVFTPSLDNQFNIDNIMSLNQDKSISGNDRDKRQSKTGEKSGLNNLQLPTTSLNLSDLHHGNATASSGINQTTENSTNWTQSQTGNNSFLNNNISAVNIMTESISEFKTTSHFAASTIAHSHASSSGKPSCQNNIFSRTPLTKTTTEKNKVDSRLPVVYLEVVSSHVCATRDGFRRVV